MAASGLVEMTDAATLEKAMNVKVPLVRLTPIKAIFPQTLEKNGVRNGSDIARCLEKLNCSLIPPKDNNSNTFSKINIYSKNSGYLTRELFQNRLGRSPSTDSIAVSNFSSDLGSVDSCHYSSNGSDSNSVSFPSSPEEPDVCSRAGSPHSVPPSPPDLNYNDDPMELDCTSQKICPLSRTVDCHSCGNNGPTFTKFSQSLYSNISNIENAQQTIIPKENYLYQSNNLVPNSKCKTFQSSNNVCCAPLLVQSNERTHSSVLDKPGVNNTSSCNNFKFSPIQSNDKSKNNTNQSNCSSSEIHHCNWLSCDMSVQDDAELVEHIRSQHVQVQMQKENYVCLWIGCKVYNKPSCSLSWLERHILRHGGSKPFKCIVDNCNQNFPTQAALQRHVNSHFDSGAHGHNGTKNGRYRDEYGFKSFRRKKHLKYKKAPAKTDDFFDVNIMEQIRYKLIEYYSGKQSPSTNNLNAITFDSKVIAVRTEKSGSVNVLLHWSPENILPDSWVSEKSVIELKRVSFSSLPPEIRKTVDPHLYDTASSDTPRVKNRRK